MNRRRLLSSWALLAGLIVSSVNAQRMDLRQYEKSLGPSDRAAVRCTVGGSCGSGSVCGENLVLTNAHVVGTRVGREVNVRAVVDGRDVNVKGRIIMAAYDDRFQTDWAIVKTTGLEGIEPVRLSKEKPSGRHYTRGCPKCVWPRVGTYCYTVDMSDTTPLWRWKPNSIGGQSGSGVYNVETNLQEGLLTWSWGGLGAGQQTSEIYRQAREKTTRGELRPDGLVTPEDLSAPLIENGFFDEESVVEKFDTEPVDTPIVEVGFYAESSIADLDIWYEPSGEDPPSDPTPIEEEPRSRILALIKLITRLIELIEEFDSVSWEQHRTDWKNAFLADQRARRSERLDFFDTFNKAIDDRRSERRNERREFFDSFSQAMDDRQSERRADRQAFLLQLEEKRQEFLTELETVRQTDSTSIGERLKNFIQWLSRVAIFTLVIIGATIIAVVYFVRRQGVTI